MDYTIKKCTKGILLPDEVYFFYYDVMRNTEDSIQFVYDWDNDIQDYLDSREIEIKEVFPATVGKNYLYFTGCEKDKGNKAVAFFRHLRNAFVHLRIVHDGKYLSIEDGQWNTKNKCWERTMMGLIKYEDLKELCFLFFEQRDKFIEENNI